MLNAMRKGASSFFMMILMGLLIASFAIWGIGDVFRQGGSTNLATVGGKVITAQQFSQEFQREFEALKQRLGPDLTPARAMSFGLGQRALQNLISQITFWQASQRLGLRVPDSRVASEIRQSDVFKNSLGQFDQYRYENLLRSANLAPRTYEEEVRRDIARRDLLQPLTIGVNVPDQLVRLLYTYQHEKRVVTLLTVPASKMNTIGEPDEETIKAYHQDHSRLFMAPEYRKLSYIRISPDDVVGDVSINDEELQKEYKNRISEFSTPEQREVQQIVVQSEETAKNWYQQIKDGADFDKIAKKASGLEVADTKLGSLTKHKLAEDINAAAATAVFALKPGMVSEPVQSMFGWHIFKVGKITPPAQSSFDQAKPKLLSEIKREKAIDEVIKFADKIDEELAGGASLSDISSNLGLKLGQIPVVDRKGLDRSGKKVTSLPDIDDFLENAFAEEVGASPILRETTKGGYYAVAVESITPPALKPLAEVRDAIIANWKADQRNDSAKAKASEIVKKVNDGTALDTLAQKANGQIHKNVTISRLPESNKKDITQEVRQAVFDLKENQAGISRAADNDGFLVVKLDKVIPGNPENDEAGVKILKKQAQAEFSNDLINDYSNALHRKYGAEINRNVANQVMEQIAGNTE